jgi:hypothetical protein
MGSVSEGQNCQKLGTITVYGFCWPTAPKYRQGSPGQLRLTLTIWELSWQMWDHRNDILHNSDVYDHLINMDATDFSIIEEWHPCPDDLAALDQLSHSMSCWRNPAGTDVNG